MARLKVNSTKRTNAKDRVRRSAKRGGRTSRFEPAIDWPSEKRRILTEARHIMELYEELGKLINRYQSNLSIGHNHEPGEAAIITELEHDKDVAEKNIREVSEELNAFKPDHTKIRKAAQTLSKVAKHTRLMLSHVIKGALEGVGILTAEGHLPGLLSQIAKALQTISTMIQNLF